MDFESVITLVLFIIFFILPSILKQVKARKKKTPQAQKVKKSSFFTKIGEQIQAFVQELEQQAQQQRQPAEAEEQLWESLSEEDKDGALSYEADEFDADTGVEYDRQAVLDATPLIQPDSPAEPVKRPVTRKKKDDPVCEKYGGPVRFRKNTLQNAVVWSEILSKPVALRDR